MDAHKGPDNNGKKMTLSKKQLGKSELYASRMGLGCMGMSDIYGKPDQQECLKTIKRAFDLGINFFDTADMYGYGHNEMLLGEAIKDIRDKVIVATKFGIVKTENKYDRVISGKPAYVKKACEDSLRHLKIDTIDLYYQHRVDPSTPIEETVQAMADLVKEGKIRYLGLSEAAADTVRRAHKVHPITALQTEYSLWSREPEKNLLQLCRELGISFVSYSPLGRGFLTGKLKQASQLEEGDYRRQSPRFMGENFEQNQKLLQKLEKIAEQKNCSIAQLALAWVLAQGEDIIPIPGTKRIKYLEENIAAASLTLSSQELQELSALFPIGVAAGLRYNERMIKVVDL